MWRNFRFLYMTNVEKSEIYSQLSCGDISDFFTWQMWRIWPKMWGITITTMHSNTNMPIGKYFILAFSFLARHLFCFCICSLKQVNVLFVHCIGHQPAPDIPNIPLVPIHSAQYLFLYAVIVYFSPTIFLFWIHIFLARQKMLFILKP